MAKEVISEFFDSPIECKFRIFDERHSNSICAMDERNFDCPDCDVFPTDCPFNDKDITIGIRIG